MESNLKVRSNIYPINHDMFQKIRGIHQIPDPNFIKQLRGKSALKKWLNLYTVKLTMMIHIKNGFARLETPV